MAVSSLDSARFALDVKGLDGLKRAAGENPKQQIEAAARQFEALFINQMLKSMRAAGFQSDLTNNKQVRFYQSLLDQQRSQSLAKKGIGLADMLVRQLSGRDDATVGSATAARIAAIPRGTPRPLSEVAASSAKVSAGQGDQQALLDRAQASLLNPSSTSPSSMNQGLTNQTLVSQSLTNQTLMDRSLTDQALISQALASRARASQALVSQSRSALPSDAEVGDENICDRFVQQFAAAANVAARQSGMPAQLILAQAALESGWGRHEISTANGANSHNLFGIKAGGGWQGAVAETGTHEYQAGQRVPVRQTFRAYRSYIEAFADHARLITDNPRYAAVRNAATPEQAARALQDCGYATDPAYADKLISIMNRIDGMVAL